MNPSHKLLSLFCGSCLAACATINEAPVEDISINSTESRSTVAHAQDRQLPSSRITTW